MHSVIRFWPIHFLKCTKHSNYLEKSSLGSTKDILNLVLCSFSKSTISEELHISCGLCPAFSETDNSILASITLGKSDTKSLESQRAFFSPFLCIMMFFIICYFRMFPTWINVIQNAEAVEIQNELFAKEVLTISPLKFYIF